MFTSRLFSVLAVAAFVVAVAPTGQAQDDTQVPDTIVVTTPDNVARGLFNEGNALLREGDNEGALAKFEEGLSQDAASSRNMYGKALALMQLEREADALEAFGSAVTLAEENGDTETLGSARRALGIISFRNAAPLLEPFPLPAENAEQALPMLEAAVAGEVDDHRLPHQMARAYNALQQFDDAEHYALLAVEAGAAQGGDNSAPYYELGLARIGKGDADGAREAFEQCIGGTWGGWAEYQIAELDNAAAGG